LVQTSTSPGETSAGSLRLYTAPGSEGPWTIAQAAAFSTPHNWGSLDNFAAGWYCVTELGDGISYSGESAKSAAVQITGA